MMKTTQQWERQVRQIVGRFPDRQTVPQDEAPATHAHATGSCPCYEMGIDDMRRPFLGVWVAGTVLGAAGVGFVCGLSINLVSTLARLVPTVVGR